MRLHTALIPALALLFCSATLHAQLTRFVDNYKVGYKDASGKMVIAAKYEAASDFKDGYAVFVKGAKRGYVNTKGEEAIAAQYDDASLFGHGLACVERSGKWGFINAANVWAIQPIYDNAFSFHNGLARVFRKGKWGMINTRGAVVVPLAYMRLYDLSDGLIGASADDIHWGYIGADGKPLLDFQYRHAAPFDETTHKAIITTATGNYYINKQGILLEKVVNKEEEEEAREHRGEPRD